MSLAPTGGLSGGLSLMCCSSCGQMWQRESMRGRGRVPFLGLSPIRVLSPLDPGLEDRVTLPLRHGDLSLCFCVPWSFGDFGHLDVLTC